MNTYPEMNEEIISLLRMTPDNPVCMYAAMRIEELEAELAALEVIEGAARVVHGADVVWGSEGIGAAKVDVVTWNVMAAALDAYDALKSVIRDKMSE